MADRHSKRWTHFALATALLLTACTKSGIEKGETVAGSSCVENCDGGEDTHRPVTIQKTQGLNVGESNSIWAVGMIKPTANQLSLHVERISLTAGENFKKMEWTIPVTGTLGNSRSGSRTFLSEWGFLIGRGNTNVTTGDVALYVVDHSLNKWERIFTASNGVVGARATPFSYRVRGSDGNDYNFIALAYRVANGIRIERFLVNPGAADLMSRFTRVRPYVASAGRVLSNAAVYSGFLFPNCGLNGCQPRFFANAFTEVQGYDLTIDVPPSPFVNANTTVRPQLVNHPNMAFRSRSHPPGGPFGSVNNRVYSMAGDPDDGYVYLSQDQSDPFAGSHVAYDRTNEIVFRTGRSSKIGPTGIRDANVPQTIVTVFRRNCFFDRPDCNPLTTGESRVFSDVGEDLGPASDLGNGCVAILGWRRTTEAGANTYRAGVYTACIRDPVNLDKGLAVMKVGEVTGAHYMYNDFTGAYMADRPNAVLFDLSERKVAGIKKARLIWVPKVGFSENLTGLTVRYRCFSKVNQDNPPPFKEFVNFPKALEMTDIPGCSGPNINMVEVEFTRIPKQRFTRIESMTLSAIR